MNKIFKGKQCTIIWHIDDLKILHVETDIVSSVLSYIGVENINTEKKTITRCKIHKYLGMTIDYLSPGKVIFYLVSYIGKIISDTPEDMRG